mmetsp:Transcript_30617/g.70647  ORF Transcript_30617/g.70647 Transcript_30617/m.70647 type:complete len:164 (+) Transcript_30617:48-539(+)
MMMQSCGMIRVSALCALSAVSWAARPHYKEDEVQACPDVHFFCGHTQIYSKEGELQIGNLQYCLQHCLGFTIYKKPDVESCEQVDCKTLTTPVDCLKDLRKDDGYYQGLLISMKHDDGQAGAQCKLFKAPDVPSPSEDGWVPFEETRTIMPYDQSTYVFWRKA